MYTPLGFCAPLGVYTLLGFCALLGVYTPLGFYIIFGSYTPPVPSGLDSEDIDIVLKATKTKKEWPIRCHILQVFDWKDFSV